MIYSAKKSNKGSLLIFADKHFRQKSINDTANQKYNTIFMNVKKNFAGFTPTLLSSRSQIFLEMAVLKNSANFIGKHLCLSLFLIKLQA